MSNRSIGLDERLHAYVMEHGVREPEILARLRAETAELPNAGMQIAPEQGAFMALLVKLIGARRCLEIGTFTGYSSLAVALALPADGHLTCLDVSREWTDIARRYWDEAGVADRVELRIGPGLESLDAMLADGADASIDFAFVDANKEDYPAYLDRLLRLLRPGGLMAWDNVFRHGEVADPAKDGTAVRATRELNRRLATDERVDVAMVPIADGLFLARLRD